MPTLTKSQKKHLSYLAAEKQRQQGSFEEFSQFPLFMLNCGQCLTDLRTSNCSAASDFIKKQHPGHQRFSFEVNVRPESLELERDIILEQLEGLGHYLVANCAKDGVVVKNARLTYKFIKAGGDVEGALKRLMGVLTHKDNAGECLADDFIQFWAKAIMRQDIKFIQRTKKLIEGNKDAK